MKIKFRKKSKNLTLRIRVFQPSKRKLSRILISDFLIKNLNRLKKSKKKKMTKKINKFNPKKIPKRKRKKFQKIRKIYKTLKILKISKIRKTLKTLKIPKKMKALKIPIKSNKRSQTLNNLKKTKNQTLINFLKKTPNQKTNKTSSKTLQSEISLVSPTTLINPLFSLPTKPSQFSIKISSNRSSPRTIQFPKIITFFPKETTQHFSPKNQSQMLLMRTKISKKKLKQTKPKPQLNWNQLSKNLILNNF